MKSLAALAAVLVVGVFSASAAHAQCAFTHPTKAKGFKGNMTQAFVSCNNPGGNTSNTTTESGTVDSCKPPETYDEQSNGGTPTSNGWKWSTLSSSAQVSFKAAVAKAPITPADSTDIKVQLKLKGIVNNSNTPVGTDAHPSTGTLKTLSRATFNDRMGGDMTVTDFPANFGFGLSGGKGGVKTTADTILAQLSQPGLPHCSNIETVDLFVSDVNDNPFARLGLFLP